MGYWEEHKCAKCGKLFLISGNTEDWVYQDNGKFYHTWSCYNHRYDDTGKRKGTKKVGKYTADGQLIQVFNSATEAADHICCSIKSMRRYISKENRDPRGFVWKYIE